MKIIDPNGVIENPVPHTVLYWGKGAHGQDLIKRWLLPSGTKEHPAHFLILPITITERAVLELLGQEVPQQDIISFAGVMAKAPNGIPSAHFLFGPPATHDLKMALAMETFDPKNSLVRSLIKLAQEKAVGIIETNKMEHDSKMAIIQGLINLWLVMIGNTEDKTIQNRLVKPWKTPIGTIVDMIHANPCAEIIIKEFFDSLPRHNYNVSRALASLIEKHLRDEDIRKFWTPNSERVIQFIWTPNSNNTSNIIVSKDSVRELRVWLNTGGHRFLAEKIKKIREAEV